MSNKTRLQTNNNNLQTILNTVNTLPEGGSGGGMNFETTTLTVEFISSFGVFYTISYPKIENESITYIDLYAIDEFPGYTYGNIELVLDDVVVGLPIIYDCEFADQSIYDNVEPFPTIGVCKITSSNPATITISSDY